MTNRDQKMPPSDSIRENILSLVSMRDSKFDKMASIVASTLGVESAYIALLDDEYEWIKGAHNFPLAKRPRGAKLISLESMLRREFIQGYKKAEKALNPSAPPLDVTESYFYAATPLRLENDIIIGAICIRDRPKHELLWKKEQDILIQFAAVIVEFLKENAMNASLIYEKASNLLITQNYSNKQLRKERKQGSMQVITCISHELRTPMNAIIGFAQMLEVKLTGIENAKYKEYAHDIHNAGKRLLITIDNILGFARKKEDQLHLDVQLIRLDEVLNRSISFCRNFAKERDVTINVDFGPSRIFLYADLFYLTQSLINLLVNSVQFIRIGGEINIKCELNEIGRILLLIRDNGSGFIYEARDNPFTSLERIEDPYVQRKQGLGFGITIAKHIIHLHKGSILIEKHVSGGTSIEIFLPAYVMPV